MSQASPFAPLVLAKLFCVPQEEVALRLSVTPDWLRKLARDPQQAGRVCVAELEAILDQVKTQAGRTNER